MEQKIVEEFKEIKLINIEELPFGFLEKKCFENWN